MVGTVEGLDLRKKRWDDVHIQSVSEGLAASGGIPPVFAMFNQLKADFCAARWLVFRSGHLPPTDTSLYMDTLDYATYGTPPSLLILAQRAAVDVLDRVAVCANEYFGLGKRPKYVDFASMWWKREKGNPPRWSEALSEELAAWNPGIIALGELASDLEENGLLWRHRNHRNTGTHRFTVLHDMGATPSRPCPAVEHYDVESFRDDAIRALRISRSAILYLLDAITSREARLANSVGVRLPLNVVPHHEIRGE